MGNAGDTINVFEG